MKRIAARVVGRLRRTIWPPPRQLELVLPPGERLVHVPEPPSGFALRTWTARDDSGLLALFHRAGFTQFDGRQLDHALSICLPYGCFLVEHTASGSIVSSMMARHVSSPEHRFGGRIDWLATDPSYRARGLGALSARAATRRLREAGYDDVYVTTDDYRLGAVKIFLDIGFRPVVDDACRVRWHRVLEALGRAPSELGV
jgi:mycothiol synthase